MSAQSLRLLATERESCQGLTRTESLSCVLCLLAGREEQKLELRPVQVSRRSSLRKLPVVPG